MVNTTQVMPQRRRPGVAAALSQELGFSQPRHISIRGGRFSLVDDSGTIIPCTLTDPQVGYYIDVVVADANQHKSKIYYGDEPYVDGDNTPPLCYSDNGIAPSTNAMEPQNEVCISCPLNETGSKISQFSGAKIKACSDRKKTAVFIWQGPPGDLLYQFTVPPASLGNMKGYLAHLQAHRLDPSDVVTRIYFEPQKTGVLNFYNVAQIDDRMDALLEYAFENNLGVSICGADDLPRQGALPAPRQQQQLPPPQQQPGHAVHAPPPQQYIAPQQQHAPAPGLGFQPIEQRGINVHQPDPQQQAGAPPPPRSGRGGARAGSGPKRGPRAVPGQAPAGAQQPAPQQTVQQPPPQPQQQVYYNAQGQPIDPRTGQAYPTPEQSEAEGRPIPGFLTRAPATGAPAGGAPGFGGPAPQGAAPQAPGNGFGGPAGPTGGAPMPQQPNALPGGMVAGAGAPDAPTLAALQGAFGAPIGR